jgi:hypothetical protein
MVDWEEKFRSWGKPPGATEKAKCENAEGMIRKAINASQKLGAHNIKVFPQGSYRNRTNIPAESDVDICVCCQDVFFTDFQYAPGVTRESINLFDSPYAYRTFKDEVGQALVEYFGNKGVTRGNKAFDVHENTYRVDADVVACFKFNRYVKLPDGRLSILEGTAFDPDVGERTINWPEQQYKNGVAKNEATAQRYKATVRVLKTLRNEMNDAGMDAAKPIPSFLMECLIYNVLNEFLSAESYVANLRESLRRIYQANDSEESEREWWEVNGLKFLFNTSQPWTRAQVKTFVEGCWNYVGFPKF